MICISHSLQLAMPAPVNDDIKGPRVTIHLSVMSGLRPVEHIPPATAFGGHPE
jgi:hypothetical protein